MTGWSADFANDPYNDYNLQVEILFNGEDIAVIKQGKDDIEMKWYANKDDLIIPFDWLVGLFLETKRRLEPNDKV